MDIEPSGGEADTKMASYFSPEQRAVLLEQGARAIQIARAHPRSRIVHRHEWLSGGPGATETLSREVTELVQRPDVFPAWSDPQVQSACEKVFAGLEPSSRTVSFGSLGNAGFDSAFRIAANLIQVAPEDDDPATAARLAIDALEAAMLAPSRRGTMYAPLMGFNLPTDRAIEFPGGVVLRATTLDDLNRNHTRATEFHRTPSACLTVEFVQPRATGPFEASKDLWLQASKSIEDAKRALGILKSGRLGDSYVETRTIERGSEGRSSRTGRIDSSPVGSYTLLADEIEPLKRIAERLAHPAWPALTFACERLVESERRWQERDSILDAVIGLEGLLLGTGSREGLRYRFAMHAAAMVPVNAREERRARFREALDLYQVRSDLAHTGMSPKGYDIAGVNLSGAAVVQRAKDLLRAAVHEFLLRHVEEVPENKERQERYWRDYWERRIFGIDGEPSLATPR